MCKPVKQIDYETGKIIMEYASIEAAAIDNFIDVSYLRKILKYNKGILKRRQLKFEFV